MSSPELLLFLNRFLRSFMLAPSFFWGQNSLSKIPRTLLSTGRLDHGSVLRTLADSSGRRDGSHAPHRYRLESKSFGSWQLQHVNAPIVETHRLTNLKLFQTVSIGFSRLVIPATSGLGLVCLVPLTSRQSPFPFSFGP